MTSERPLIDAASPHPPAAASQLPPSQPEPPVRADHLGFSVEVPDPFRPSRRDQPDPSASERELHEGGEYRDVAVGEPSPEFAGNAVRTAKYSALTFLPRNLFEQFRRLSYVYFLAITVLNQLPQVAVFGRGASVLPLAFVLFVTAVKDAYEDIRRHRSDRRENNRLAAVLAPQTAGEYLPKKWKHIRVGDVVRVASNETLPADMVLLATSDPTGLAHVQTVNLDGEINLKTRYAKQETQLRFSHDGHVAGMLHCERPNRNIYGFQANLEIDGKRVSLGPSNIVLRGCELKNTTWAIGVVVYAGKETKVMLNNSGPPSKRSLLETQLNRETVILSIMLIGMCITASVLAGIWLLNHQRELEFTQFFREKDYTTGKNYNYYGIGMQIFVTFLMAVIVYQVIIPISLYISMELVRLGQAYFMGADNDLYDESSRSRFQCRALNINEDLGQIKYVFSDKTGTLTENKMEFMCASIHGVDYSSGKPACGSSVVVRTDPQLLKLLNNDSSNEEAKLVLEFFLALAACNTIVPLVLDTRDPKQKLIDYQGESPDEQALAYAAASYGIVLVERTSGYVVIDVLGDRQRFDILGLHEFDSDRKRMSVIVSCPDKTVKLYVKGADSSMFGIINKSLELDNVRATEAHLHKYSSLGLRTLVVGMRELSQPKFEEWQLAYEKASTAVLGRGNLLRSIAANVECNIHILGASGIEDKLQDGVPEAIESLRQAGMKVWILTGDKQETAISIGYSCKLLTNDMRQIVINNNSKESCKKSLEEALARTKEHRVASSIGSPYPVLASESSGTVLALIVDGNSLVYILDTELQEELFKVATECSVVLCCRVAPLQKAGIVALIKNRTDDMTLAIGDGANDVSMIQMADVGVGISGQEGGQAVMASDFSMGQFRFLVPLLLVHGHWNYQRMGYMILYNFYKNATFVLVLFWYVLYTSFTLTTAITEWSSLLYTVLYTSLPTIVVGILDKDLSKSTLLAYPKLYGSGQRNEKYNLNLFVLNMLEALWQSLVVFYIPYFAYRQSTIGMSSLGDLWALASVIVVNMQLAMDIIRWNWIIHAFVWGTIAATVICLFVIDSIWVLPGYGAIYHIMGQGLFWLLLLIIVVTAMVPHFAIKAFTEHFVPSDIQIGREIEKFEALNQVNRSEIPMRTFS
ncbi:unnamed protein product [Triticum turgidum subsp. durum]|uniref:Phospholipid-transporting ATPase n=1 Tax=Triticum turgidum subsp. durum TaxID=4567 RepID=A0A9R1QHR9_TRITD|nr:unnamed protein product [Triticum turgidum subsp. durum]